MAVQKYLMTHFTDETNTWKFDYDIKEILKHELKNPICANSIMLNLLLNKRFGKLNKNQEEILVNAIASSEYTLLILNNFLSYKEITKLSPNIYNIKTIIKSVSQDLDLILRDKKQEICLDFDSEKTLLNIDKKEISRVFYNLIVNLAELSDDGSKNVISLKKSEHCIEIFFMNETYKNKCSCDFSVKKINKFKKMSTNLSFDVCKKIIKLHNGKISINPFKNPKYVYKITLNIER